MSGWVKLHRDIESWEWVNDEFMVSFFLRIVLMANYEDKKWRGETIKRGSFITSYVNLAEKFGCGVQKIRTALERLKVTHEITCETTSKYTVISITNYEKYNDDNTQNNKQITNKKQTNNKQITLTKEVKEIKNKRKENILSHNANASLVLDSFNRITGKNLSPTNSNLKHINARLNEISAQHREFDLKAFETVIKAKHAEWSENATMAKYVRPATLFGDKFESYLDSALNKPKTVHEKLADFFNASEVESIPSEVIMNNGAKS